MGLCTRYDVSGIDDCDVLFVPQNRAGSGDSLEHKTPFDRVGHDPFSYLISPTPPAPTCAKHWVASWGMGPCEIIASEERLK